MARRLHCRGTSAPLEHQIIDRSAIRPRFNSFDQTGPNRVPFNVVPFFCVVFTGSKVPIEIFRLPDWRLNRERCYNPTGTHALPQPNPSRHALGTDFRSRKEMYVVGHDNIIAYPPAVVFGRTLPDIMQNPVALRRSENFASLICACCKKDNRVVTERRYMCQMAKWSRVPWRRPALGPKKV
jgi:hypothetical protein